MTISKARLLSQAISKGGSLETIIASTISTSDITEGNKLFYTKNRNDSDTNSLLQNLSTNIVPSQNITYDLGSPSNRFRDLYISTGTIYFGDSANDPAAKTFEPSKILDFDLGIEPETMTMGVDAPFAGHGQDWIWSWDVVSALSYARTKIRSQTQANVPIYKKGNYTIFNFAAHELHGPMTQTHKIYLKWIEGAGLQNIPSWSVETLNVENISFLDMNGGQSTEVQRLVINVPENPTIPSSNELTPPTVTYNVSFVNPGSYMIMGPAMGSNASLGPVRRGGTYTFNLDSSISGHPFYLTTASVDSFSSGNYIGEYTTGVTGSRNQSGQLVWQVDSSAPDTLYYQCGIHGAMRGEITVKDLKLDSNGSGIPILYFQHTQEGHRVPVELREVPAAVSQMCLTFDGNKFVPQDLNQYVQKTNIFQETIKTLADEKIEEQKTAGTIATVETIKDTTVYNVNLSQQGELKIHQGTARWYAPFNLSMIEVLPRLGTAADASVAITVQVNDSDQFSFIIPPNSTSVQFADSDEFNMIDGDYLTVDVTGIGNTLKGENLVLQFKYKKV
jgi:hypothetical protein